MSLVPLSPEFHVAGLLKLPGEFGRWMIIAICVPFALAAFASMLTVLSSNFFDPYLAIAYPLIIGIVCAIPTLVGTPLCRLAGPYWRIAAILLIPSFWIAGLGGTLTFIDYGSSSSQVSLWQSFMELIQLQFQAWLAPGLILGGGGGALVHVMVGSLTDTKAADIPLLPKVQEIACD